MFKVSFVYNGYAAEVTSETPESLEMDVIECRTVLHKLPPAIPVRPLVAAESVTPSPDGADVTPMGNGSSFQEIIPVTAIEKADLRGGKKAFKVRGGKYEDWGVMMYPDTCIFKDNIVPSMVMNEVVSGLEALVIKKDGKLRVAALRRKAQNA